MARHKLSLSEQRAGIAAALKSKKTPAGFRPSLQRRLEALDRELRKNGRGSSARGVSPKFLGWFQF